MIVIAITLLAFAVSDLLRWTPEWVSPRRAALSVGGGVIAVAAVVGFGGWGLGTVAGAAGLSLVALVPWQVADARQGAAAWPLELSWLALVVLGALAVSGSASDPIGGDLARWYDGLDFSFAQSVSADKALLCIASFLFLTCTANRVVRLVLQAAGTPAAAGESALKGGRLLGPMERLLVAALVLAGDVAGASFVVAAKGLLRFPEVSRQDPKANVTEYLLIGTFASLLLAAGLGLLILASS